MKERKNSTKNGAYNCIIIGAGPAGLTAGIYAARRAMKTLIISKDMGGQLATTTAVENYPGFDSVSGMALADKFKTQTEKFGVEFKFEEVRNIKKEKEDFLVETDRDKLKTQTVILALGLSPANLGIPGEEKFRGKGVSYCATCDGPFFRGKNVAVVGGGNSALNSTLYLSQLAKKVYLVHRREEFRGDAILVERIKKAKNVELILNVVPSEIIGEGVVRKLSVKNIKTNKTQDLTVDGVFAQVGYKVGIDFLKGLVKVDNKNQVITDKICQTSEPGVFAAGDMTDISYKQIVIAAGEGAKAALSAYKYFQGKNSKIPAKK